VTQAAEGDTLLPLVAALTLLIIKNKVIALRQLVISVRVCLRHTFIYVTRNNQC
jgi:hypothetical protein